MKGEEVLSLREKNTWREKKVMMLRDKEVDKETR